MTKEQSEIKATGHTTTTKQQRQQVQCEATTKQTNMQTNKRTREQTSIISEKATRGTTTTNKHATQQTKPTNV